MSEPMRERARELLTRERLSVKYNEDWLMAALEAVRAEALEEAAKVADKDREDCFKKAYAEPQGSERYYRWMCAASASNVVAGLIRALSQREGK
jgi:hypothetical protein